MNLRFKTGHPLKAKMEAKKEAVHHEPAAQEIHRQTSERAF
jgi:hypothetical protein